MPENEEPIVETEPTEESVDAEMHAAIAELEQQVTPAEAEEPLETPAEEPKAEEEEPFDMDAASLRHVMSIQDPAKRKAAIEQLARAEGLELKLPGESKDEQELAAKVGEKKITRLTADQIKAELEAGGVTVDLTDEEIGTVDGLATLMSAHSQMKTEQARSELRQEMQAEKEQQEAVQQFETYLDDSSVALATEYGNAEAAPILREILAKGGPGAIDATLKNPALAEMADFYLQSKVKEFNVAKEQGGEKKLPLSEDVGGKANADSVPDFMKGQKEAYNRSGLNEHMSFEEFAKGIKV